MKEKNYNKHIDKETESYYYISKTNDMIKLSYQDYMECVEAKKKKKKRY